MIKNLGGVFGRNPTFNNVEVEGDLTVDGNYVVAGDIAVTGNATITGTLDVTGQITGNVTGNLTGNADTVTNGAYVNVDNNFSVFQTLQDGLEVYLDAYLDSSLTVGTTITSGAINGLTVSSVNGTGNTVVGNAAGTTLGIGAQHNVLVGLNAGDAISTGDRNIGIGKDALGLLSTTADNVAIGYQAGDALTTGSTNVAIGSDALGATNIGTSNTAVGTESLYNTTTSSNNTAIGYQAGRYIADGATAMTATANAVYVGYGVRGSANSVTNETAIGYGAIGLGSNTTAIGNSSTTAAKIWGALTVSSTAASTASTGSLIVLGGISAAKDSHINGHRIGTGLLANQTNLGVGENTLQATIAGGINNTAIGYRSGQALTSGSSNTLLGYAVGAAITTGTSNCVIGGAALNQCVSGSFNTAMGFGALQNATGSNNTGVGIAALKNITTGSLNTGIGREAGAFQSDGVTALTTANNSVYIGRDTRGTQTDSNSVVIGYQTIGLGPNTTTVGSTSTLGNRIFGVASTGQVAPTIASATTIAPTTSIVFVSGVTPIVTITAPSLIATTGGQITLIPTGMFTTTIAGNIALASAAVVSKALIMTYDATTTKWYPSY